MSDAGLVPQPEISYIHCSRPKGRGNSFRLNLLIEIKSKYWWDIHLEKNLIKEKNVKDCGYNYIVIMDKDYLEFQNIIDKLNFQVKCL